MCEAAAPASSSATRRSMCARSSRAPGRADESAFAALHAFCSQMCAKPRLPRSRSTAATIGTGRTERTARRPCSPTRSTSSSCRRRRESAVRRHRRRLAAGARQAQVRRRAPGIAATTSFPTCRPRRGDRSAGARPGIWIRPLLAPADAPDAWRLAARPHDSRSHACPKCARKSRTTSRACAWGFELIKHDYTTFDIFGRWGSRWATALTRDGWTFAAGPSRTTAEVIDDLYRDDSRRGGRRARHRLQHRQPSVGRAFRDLPHRRRHERHASGRARARWASTRWRFAARSTARSTSPTPDCVGVTNAVPWALNRQWLDLLARSGTMLFVSLAPDALGDEQRRDLRAALALAASRSRSASRSTGSSVLAAPLEARWARRPYDWVPD